ncbi:MAG TPA: response regulator transcription factor [Terriglobia bacterium]|nr:response regulator transcription factor [Terriglobia bacterium]
MTAVRRRILLVEDEPNLRRTVSDMLVNEGYTVDAVGDGLEGQKKAMSEPYDLIVLDVMLPSRSGFDVCRHLRQNHVDAPILMLTARSELSNKVQGFNAGADDYLTKPFDAPELQVRIAALFRRAPNAARARLKAYEFSGIRVDFVKTRLVKNGQSVNLSDREARLLQYLIAYKGEPVSRDELLQQVWGYSATPLTRTVDVHIAWLRQKIEDDPANPKFILTVHGQGYRFVD